DPAAHAVKEPGVLANRVDSLLRGQREARPDDSALDAREPAARSLLLRAVCEVLGELSHCLLKLIPQHVRQVFGHVGAPLLRDFQSFPPKRAETQTSRGNGPIGDSAGGCGHPCPGAPPAAGVTDLTPRRKLAA